MQSNFGLYFMSAGTMMVVLLLTALILFILHMDYCNYCIMLEWPIGTIVFFLLY